MLASKTLFLFNIRDRYAAEAKSKLQTANCNNTHLKLYHSKISLRRTPIQ
jgi:hypothetical protein